MQYKLIPGYRALSILLVAVFLIPAAVSAQSGYGGGGGGGGGGLAPIAGDATGDRRVNILDFNSLLAAWGRTGGGLAQDMNWDGKVDIFDFNILMANWDR